MSTRRHRSVFALLAATVLTATPALATPPLRTVQINTNNVPGLPVGISFFSMSDARITPNGRVYFGGDLTGASVPADDSALCLETSGVSKSLIYRESNQAPGLAAGVTFSYAYGAIVNDFNQLLLDADLTGPGVTTSNDHALYAGTAFVPTLLAREGSQAAGLPAGVVHVNLSGTAMNHVGKVMYHSDLSGTGVDASNAYAIFAGLPGSTAPVLRYGTQAPNMAAGVVHAGLINYTPGLNDAGEMALSSFLTGPGVTTNINDNASWYGHPGAWTTIARRGNQAPGLPAGVNYGVADAHPRLNNSNQLALLTTLQGAGVTTANDTAIFFGTAGSVSPIFREGTQLPGQPGGILMGEIKTVLLSDNGLVVARSAVTGPGVTTHNNEAYVVTRTGGTPTTIFRWGDQAPGQPAGVVYGDPFVTSLNINARGLVAYTAPLAGAGVDNTNWSALFAGTPGNIGCVLRGGQTVEVAPGDVRTVYSLAMGAGFSDGVSTPACLSSTNQLTFTVYFTNSTSATMVATICAADFNHSGVVSVQDIFDFLAAYFAGSMAADMNSSLTVTVQDIFDFLAAYFSGC